jgi:superfamily II DNA or RNA helicase
MPIIKYGLQDIELRGLSAELAEKIRDLTSYTVKVDAEKYFQSTPITREEAWERATYYPATYWVNKQDSTYTLRIPTGFYLRLSKILERDLKPHNKIQPVELDLKNLMAELGLQIRSHQVEAVEALLKCPRGQVVLPTGAGKSYIIALFLRHFPNVTALVVVPKIDLQNQLIKTLERVLQQPIGAIGGGKSKIERVTVAVWNSISEHRYSEYLKTVEAIIIDECHERIDNQRRLLDPIVKKDHVKANPSIRVGVTATPQKDGREFHTEGLIGPILYTVPRERLESENIIICPEFYYIPYAHQSTRGRIFNGYTKGGYWHGKEFKDIPRDLDHYKACCTDNEDRNELILGILKAFIDWEARTGPGLCFTASIEHSNLIVDRLKELKKPKYTKVCSVSSETKTKDRNQILDKARAGELNLLVAANILNVGVDIPSLQVGFLTNPCMNEIRIVQRIGRILRTSKQKGHVIICVFLDSEDIYYTNRSIKAKRALHEEYPTSKHIELTAAELVNKFKTNTF